MLGDSYASAAEARERWGKDDDSEDAAIGAALEATSQYLDRRCRRPDGFNANGVLGGDITNTIANPTVVSTTVNHGLVTGNAVYITGSNSTPTIDGTHTVIVISPTTFSVPVNVTGGGTAGSATKLDVRVYDGNGKARVWLPDDIATTTGLLVKADLNGDYDYTDSDETLTVDTHFWAGPWNSAPTRPYEFLELIPTNSVATSWPNQRRAIQVTAKFGWPTVPVAIKELTIALTRYLRDIQESGVTFSIQAIDSAVQESREMSFFLKNIERQYARPPTF